MSEDLYSIAPNISKEQLVKTVNQLTQCVANTLTVSSFENSRL